MKPKTENFIIVDDITVRFARWGQSVLAIDHLTLSIPRGQWVILTGHNGAGKSTLLKVMCGRIAPQLGRVLVGGEDVARMSARKIAASTFLVHQDPLLGTAATLTVYENLLVADDDAAIKRLSRSNLYKKYAQLLEPLGLRSRLRQPVRSLSGGERQLLALLIARLRPAHVILLDEPLAALDPENSKHGVTEIAALHRVGKTIVHVAHEHQHLLNLSDRLVVLEHGQVVRDTLRGEPHGHEAAEQA